MAERALYMRNVQQTLSDALDQRESLAVNLNPQLSELFRVARELLLGGKRFRAQFVYLGWLAAATEESSDSNRNRSEGPAPLNLAKVAAALELFHAAALVHDDLIDNSDTRRGGSSVHRLFEELHSERNWAGESEGFGRASAILLGDLLLSWSEEDFNNSLGLLPEVTLHSRARSEFDQMRTEVMYGQYLDVLAGQVWSTDTGSLNSELTNQVIVLKSAKYSVEAPLRIGCSVGNGTDQLLRALSSFGLPIGIAFQLRDDLLGVFGDPLITGKPAGDDLREGKRTMLVSIARSRFSKARLRDFDQLLGDRSLSASQIERLQSMIADSGALEEVEALIAENAKRGFQELSSEAISPVAAQGLRELAEKVLHRSS
ncbi:MAG: polyprenyl synthetase family protein [Microbacteriaceae bacterium]|nr:polyprenyl synthetase family protein [Microbacteriaceae bacterium]